MGKKKIIEDAVLAIEQGDAKKLQKLLQKGLSPNELLPLRSVFPGAPLLIEAIKRDQLACVETLLAAGADPNFYYYAMSATRRFKTTPLAYCITGSITKYFQRLLNHNPAAARACLLEDDQTYLHVATTEANVEICQLLVDAGFSVHAIDTRSRSTPLHILIYRNGATAPQKVIQVIDILCAAGASLEAKTAEELTPVVLAVKQRAWVVAEYLLGLGAGIGFNSNIVLMVALNHYPQSKAVIDKILDHESNIFEVSTVLNKICEQDNVELLEYFLNKRPTDLWVVMALAVDHKAERVHERLRELAAARPAFDDELAVGMQTKSRDGAGILDSELGSDGQTETEIWKRYDEELCGLVVEGMPAQKFRTHIQRIDPRAYEVMPDFGVVAACKAIKIQRLDLLKILCEQGLDISFTNEEGHTPLCHAVIYGSVQVVRYLIEDQRADPNWMDKFDKSCGILEIYPLTEAVRNRVSNAREKIQVLLAHGANRQLKDGYGKTAFDYACEQQNVLLMAELCDLTVSTEVEKVMQQAPASPHRKEIFACLKQRGFSNLEMELEFADLRKFREILTAENAPLEEIFSYVRKQDSVPFCTLFCQYAVVTEDMLNKSKGKSIYTVVKAKFDEQLNLARRQQQELEKLQRQKATVAERAPAVAQAAPPVVTTQTAQPSQRKLQKQAKQEAKQAQRLQEERQQREVAAREKMLNEHSDLALADLLEEILAEELPGLVTERVDELKLQARERSERKALSKARRVEAKKQAEAASAAESAEGGAPTAMSAPESTEIGEPPIAEQAEPVSSPQELAVDAVTTTTTVVAASLATEPANTAEQSDVISNFISGAANSDNALHMAIRLNDCGALIRALQEGADVKQKDHQGLTPFGLSASVGHHAAFELLLPECIKHFDVAFDALLIAFKANKQFLFMRLFNALIDHEGHMINLLERAYDTRETELLRVLYTQGTLINQADSHGRTSLGMAIEREDTSACRVLISRGVNVQPEQYMQALSYKIKRYEQSGDASLLLQFKELQLAITNQQVAQLRYAANAPSGFFYQPSVAALPQSEAQPGFRPASQ